MAENKQHSQKDDFAVRDKRFWADGQTPEDEPVTKAQDSAPGNAADSGRQTLAFQAETKQLLELMIHSLYSNKEIFLRELISNASDAIDRLRFESLLRPELKQAGDAQIRLETNADERTLTIIDNGIGMSREEVVRNIGTIAKSGTRELISRLKQAEADNKDGDDAMQLIGQFGVGFYSAFMVADRISMVTRRAGEDDATRWESVGDGTFTIDEADRPNHGTSITLHLKPTDTDNGLEDFTDEWVLSRIVKRYSDFIPTPIVMQVEREETEKDEDGKPKEDGKKTRVIEDKTLNSMKAIWKRRKSDVEQSEYNEFYKHVAHDWQDPLRTIAVSAEGRIEYQALLFIPSQAPFDFYQQGYESGLQLFVNNVKIMERCEELLPRYLRFVRGVVESSDLPLNVSRELLQNDRQIAQIQRGLVKKIIDTLTTMQRDELEDYLTFWKPFGNAIKEGAGTDDDNKDKLVPLLMFQSSADAEKLTTLKQYVERMPDEQETIYYLTGESRAIVENSPHLEAFRDKGYEVLYFVDPVDELIGEKITEFEGKKLQSAAKGTADLGTEEEKEKAEKERSEKQEELSGLLKLIKEELDEDVKEVRLSSRLKTSAVCLVGGEHDMSPQLERLLQQQMGAGMGGKQKRIMELNPDHPIVSSMKKRFESDEKDPVLPEYAHLLLGQALLAEGSELSDPGGFSRRVAELMVRAS